MSLRAIAPEHAAPLFALMKDPRISTYLAWNPPGELAETVELVAALARAHDQGSGYHWTIFEGADVRGLISLIDVRRRHREWRLDRAEIAYWIQSECQGRGLATEAASAVVDAAFGALGLNRVIVSHTSANAASGRIPQKLGFRAVGLERQFFEKNGTWYDMMHYEMLAQDWGARFGASGKAAG